MLNHVLLNAEAERKACEDEGFQRNKANERHLVALKQTTMDIRAQLSEAARSKPADCVAALLARSGVDIVNYTTKSVAEVLRDVDARIADLVKAADLATHQTRQVMFQFIFC